LPFAVAKGRLETMERIRLGVIGLGLMGRELASAVARWPHLPDLPVRPEIVSICSAHLSEPTELWYRSICPSIAQATRDYRELLKNPDVEVVYIAVPHALHAAMYVEALEAGKHLFGEKPFGIDLEANTQIGGAIDRHPELFVRCSSQFPFAPGVQELCRRIEAEELGRILAVEAGFLHSSDLNPMKPINWKRRAVINGEYGCMGDLGMHVCHVPFRAGWQPRNVRAVLSNIITERPDGNGRAVACDTWDNATLLCETTAGGDVFPMTLRMHRIAPGQSNTWYLEVYATRTSLRFSTRNINVLEVLDYDGGEQTWRTLDVGHRVTYPSITGAIFEFGFSDAILQMAAAFFSEMIGSPAPGRFATCVRPEEVALSHSLFTAALRSQAEGVVAEVGPSRT
jgi:predicted dehydrogenase